MQIVNISTPKVCFSLTLLAWTMSGVLNTAHAEGYEIQKANRSGVKNEAWSFKQCQSQTGRQGNVSATLAHNDPILLKMTRCCYPIIG